MNEYENRWTSIYEQWVRRRKKPSPHPTNAKAFEEYQDTQCGGALHTDYMPSERRKGGVVIFVFFAHWRQMLRMRKKDEKETDKFDDATKSIAKSMLREPYFWQWI